MLMNNLWTNMLIQRDLILFASLATTFLVVLFIFSEEYHSVPSTVKATDNLQLKPGAEICSNKQRIDRVKRWCDVQANINKSPFAHLSSMDDKTLKKVVRKFLVDEKHKVIYCDIAKAGSTSWKHILANNTGVYSETNSQSIHDKHRLKRKYNITQLKLYDRHDILLKLSDYFNFMVVRHPLDRLVSGYKDKLDGGNAYYERVLGRKVLKTQRKNISSKLMHKGNGVKFEEYVKYLIQNHMKDQHFENYQDHCNPCIIPFDYIGKLETHYTDAKYIIMDKLSGYGADSLGNKHSNRGGATSMEQLPEFENIESYLLQEVSAVYRQDMDMFGYSVSSNEEGQIYARCGDGTDSECC